MAVNYLQWLLLPFCLPIQHIVSRILLKNFLAVLHEEDSECQAKFQEFVKELYATLKSIMEVSQLFTMVN